MDLAGYRILVVDDHLLIRRIVAAELKMSGNPEIDEAIDGEAALQKIEAAIKDNRPYKIIFLDLAMPKLDGFSVLQMCRANPALNNTSIIMLTADGDELNIIKALEAGATAYILKPFKPEYLSQKVQDVLELKSNRVEYLQ